MEKEVIQLLIMDAIEPDETKDLTNDDQRDSRGYLIFLKEKCDNGIKVRGLCGGRKQRYYITKQ